MAEALPNVFELPDAPRAKRQLEGLVRVLKRRLEALERRPSPRYQIDPGVTRSGNATVGFWHVTRVAPNAGATVRVRLPKATAEDGGLSCGIIRDSTDGSVFVYPAAGSLLNGQASVFLTSAKMFFIYVFDGTNWYATHYGGAPES